MSFTYDPTNAGTFVIRGGGGTFYDRNRGELTLAYLKVPTAMVRFVNEYHGTTSTPSNFIRTQLILRHWFERHSRPSRTITTSQQ